ncbi:MAG: hypothetical protein IKT68_03800 [Clostridia bacterium]|nr:hypothetical protein [Clostridia bacterium]
MHQPNKTPHLPSNGVCQNTDPVRPTCGTAHKLQQKTKGKTMPQPVNSPESQQFM